MGGSGGLEVDFEGDGRAIHAPAPFELADSCDMQLLDLVNPMPFDVLGGVLDLVSTHRFGVELDRRYAVAILLVLPQEWTSFWKDDEPDVAAALNESEQWPDALVRLLDVRLKSVEELVALLTFKLARFVVVDESVRAIGEFTGHGAQRGHYSFLSANWDNRTGGAIRYLWGMS